MTERFLHSCSQILPTVKEALLLVLRAHLMLFYFEGIELFIITDACYAYDFWLNYLIYIMQTWAAGRTTAIIKQWTILEAYNW